MSAFLYLGKMRNNKVTCHKICHHYNYLICILQAGFELCVHFVISSHRSLSAPQVGIAVIFKHPQERWDQLETVQSRGCEWAEEHLIGPGWCRVAGSWAVLSRGKPQAEGSSICSWLGNSKAKAGALCPLVQTETDKQERAVWDAQGKGAFTKWGKAWEKFH